MANNTLDISEDLLNTYKSSIDKQNATLTQVITEIIESLNTNDPQKISNAQNKTLHEHQHINSLIHQQEQYKAEISTHQLTIDRDKLILMLKDTTYNTKGISVGDKKTLLSGDTPNLYNMLFLINTHIDFLKESRQTLRDIQYAIKNKIDLINLMGG